MRLEIRELKQVAAIAREGGFAKAAKVLHISQPALSRSIRDVEFKVGCQLFTREREGTFLTDAGLAFMNKAADLLAMADDMERELALIKENTSGHVHVGGGMLTTDFCVVDSLAAFSRKHPQARIHLHSDIPDVLIRQLRQRELDLIVIDHVLAGTDPDIQKTEMLTHQGHAVVRAGHPLLEIKKLGVHDVVKHPFATLSNIPNRIIRMGNHLSGGDAEDHKLIAKWAPAFTANTFSALRTMVARTDHVMVTSLKMVRHELESGELAVLPIILPWLKTSFAVLRLAHRTLPTTAQALIREIIAEDAKVLEMENALAARWLGKPTRKSGAAASRIRKA